MSKFREIVAETFNRVNKRDGHNSNKGTDSSGTVDSAMNDKNRKDKNHYVSISLIAENFEGNYISCHDFVNQDKIDFQEENFHPNEYTEVVADRIICEFSRRMATNVNFDEQHNILLLVLAALSVNSDVCKLVIDKVSPNIINIMKTIKEICGVTFKLKQIDDD